MMDDSGRVFKCHRCSGEWVGRVVHPKQCRYCKSPYWDRPRGVRVAVEEIADCLRDANRQFWALTREKARLTRLIQDLGRDKADLQHAVRLLEAYELREPLMGLDGRVRD